MTIILFDVCHTLYESNTTFDFLADFFGEDPSYLALARKRRSWSGRVRAKFGRYEQDLRNDLWPYCPVSPRRTCVRKQPIS